MRQTAVLALTFLIFASFAQVQAEDVPIPAPPPQPPAAVPDSNISGAPFLAKIKSFVDEGNLEDYDSLARILGTQAVLGEKDDPLHQNAPGPVTVTLKSSPEINRLPKISYTVVPRAVLDLRYSKYQPPFHELAVNIMFGRSLTLSKFYCIKWEDAVNAFGANDMQAQDAEYTYDRKFNLEAVKGYDIYVTLYFGFNQYQREPEASPVAGASSSPGGSRSAHPGIPLLALMPPPIKPNVRNTCAQSLSLAQYIFKRPL